MVYYYKCSDCAENRFREFCICSQSIISFSGERALPNYIRSETCQYPKQHWKLTRIYYGNGKENEFPEENQPTYEVKR